MNLTPKSLFEVPFSRTKELWLYVVDIFKYKIYKMLNNRNLSFIQELFSFVCLFFFLSTWVFFHEHSRFTGQQWKGEGICLTPLYHFHPLRRHLDISRAITVESSPLPIASSRTQTGNLCLTCG